MGTKPTQVMWSLAARALPAGRMRALPAAAGNCAITIDAAAIAAHGASFTVWPEESPP